MLAAARESNQNFIIKQKLFLSYKWLVLPEWNEPKIKIKCRLVGTKLYYETNLGPRFNVYFATSVTRLAYFWKSNIAQKLG